MSVPREGCWQVILSNFAHQGKLLQVYWSTQRAVHMLELRSRITCPTCGHSATETMPTDACVYVFRCKACGLEMKPKKGQCCVFCSYGDVPCPPVQEERSRRQS